MIFTPGRKDSLRRYGVYQVLNSLRLRFVNLATWRENKKLLVKRNLIIILILVSASSFSQEIKRIKITDLEKTINESEGPLIVNFWATYCVPCLAEIPHFQEMAKQYKDKGVRLILVSLDMKDAYPKKINTIARKLKLNPPIYWLDESNADYFCPKVDSSWSGALPSSLFINHHTGYRKFFEDELSKERLEKEIKSMIAPKQN
jgi:thiol-disulfide isomerase/thioredoxin